jgi:hypothetical protein
VVLAGVAGAGPVTPLQQWAEKETPEVLDAKLRGYGFTNQADRAALTAGWDEQTVVDTALKCRAYAVLCHAAAFNGLSRPSLDRITAQMVQEDAANLVEIVLAYPVAEREQFRAAVTKVAQTRYATIPVFGDYFVDLTAMRGLPFMGEEWGAEALIRVLLADERLLLVNAQKAKESLKRLAVRLAREKLRAEGRSFVMKDGVNPLEALARPVVAALNAPECAGLEAAFRALGVEVADQERGGVRASAGAWRAQIESGEATDVAFLGKIAVVLGPEGYNRFVDEYNTGKAGE